MPLSPGALQTPRFAVALAMTAVLSACSGGDRDGAGAPVVASFGGVGTGPGQFAYPRAIDADGDSLWVIDKSARVQRIDAASGRVRASWTMPDYVLGKPTGVTVAAGPAGKPAVYVPDTHYQRIMVYSVPADGAEPTLLAGFGSYGRGPGEFIYPTDVAVLPNATGTSVERLYVTEYGGNDRVSAFDSQHQFLFAFGSFESGEDEAGRVEFNRPQSVVVDASRRRLIVADACNHRLGVFDLEGRLERWIGSRDEAGASPGTFRYPYGLALCEDGNVLVSEFGNHRVQRVDPQTGRALATYCSMGRGEGEVINPWGVALIGSTAYVLDSGNNRVLGLDLARSTGRLALEREPRP